MNRFEEQVAIVTGGAQGIGFGIAERLGREGARIVLLDINAKGLAAAERALAGRRIAVLARFHHPNVNS